MICILAAQIVRCTSEKKCLLIENQETLYKINSGLFKELDQKMRSKRVDCVHVEGWGKEGGS